MPGGFKYVATLTNGDPSAKLKTFDIAASHASRLAIGDVVRITGTATAVTSVPQVDAAAAGQSVTGVVAGFVPNYATESFTDTGLPASTAGTALVICDPLAYYEVDVSNGPLVVADVGLNADIVATAATLNGGLSISNMTINSTGKATTSTLQFRIEKLLTDSAGVLGNRALVRVNNDTFITGATGV